MTLDCHIYLYALQHIQTLYETMAASQAPPPPTPPTPTPPVLTIADKIAGTNAERLLISTTKWRWMCSRAFQKKDELQRFHEERTWTCIQDIL